MREAIERFFLGSRWRQDEDAWRTWQRLQPLIRSELPVGEGPTIMAGRVVRVYQRARRGSKVIVDFGPALGHQDTWWEFKQPPVGVWVVVHAHYWDSPETHSGEYVLWIDHWESWAPGDVQMRALRHQQRLEKRAAREMT